MNVMDTTLTSSLSLLKQSWSLAVAKPNRIAYLVLGILPQIFSYGFAFLTGLLVNNDNLESNLTSFLSTTNGWILAGLLVILIILGTLLAIYIGTWYTAILYNVYQTTALKKTNSLLQHIHPSKLVIMRLFTTSLKIGIFAVLGFLFLIIPGIIITVRYAFAPFIAVTESKERDPLTESKYLVLGRFWKLAQRSVIPFIFYSIPLTVFQTIHPILGAIWSVSSPIFGLYFYLVYLDFKRTAPATA